MWLVLDYLFAEVAGGGDTRWHRRGREEQGE